MAIHARIKLVTSCILGAGILATISIPVTVPDYVFLIAQYVVWIPLLFFVAAVLADRLARILTKAAVRRVRNAARSEGFDIDNHATYPWERDAARSKWIDSGF